MLLVTILFLLNASVWPSLAADQCGQLDTSIQKRSIEQINERYDDFFRYQRYLEQREESLESGRGENKGLLAERERRNEEARLEFLKARRPRPDTSALEQAWIVAEKERADRIESARDCTVQQRSQLEQIMRRGRRIPEMQEFHLEE
jgi:hypothetical protein